MRKSDYVSEDVSVQQSENNEEYGSLSERKSWTGFGAILCTQQAKEKTKWCKMRITKWRNWVLEMGIRENKGNK